MSPVKRETCATCPAPLDHRGMYEAVPLTLMCEDCASAWGKRDLITKTHSLKEGVTPTALDTLQYKTRRNPHATFGPPMRLYVRAEVAVLAAECNAAREKILEQRTEAYGVKADERGARLGFPLSEVPHDLADAVFGDYLWPVSKPTTLRRDVKRAHALIPLAAAASALFAPRAAALGCGPLRAVVRAAVLRFAQTSGRAAPKAADTATAAAALADALLARVELTRAAVAAGAEHVLAALAASDAAAARSALPGLAAAAAAAAKPTEALRRELVRLIQAAPAELAVSTVNSSSSSGAAGGSSSSGGAGESSSDGRGGGAAAGGGGGADGSSSGGSSGGGVGGSSGGGGGSVTAATAADALLKDPAVARRLRDFEEFHMSPGAMAQRLARFAAARSTAAAARRAELAAAMARLGTDANEVNRCARARERRERFETGAVDLDADEVAAMLQMEAKLAALPLPPCMVEAACADMEREYRRQVYQFGHSSKEALRVARKRLARARRDASATTASPYYDCMDY